MRVPSRSDPLVRTALGAAGALARYHDATLEGERHLPKGAALLVGNHGLLGLDTPVLFFLLQRATGKLPTGLADRKVFAPPPLRAVLQRLGGVPGTPDNALELLRQGEHVVCYPGGSREVFKRSDQRYQLQWEAAQGFARVAIQAQVPVIPFAGLGVDDTCLHFGHARPLRFLGRYAPPLAVGPLPVKLRFVLSAPILPPAAASGSGASLDDAAAELKREVQRAVENLLARGDAPAARLAPATVLP